jgi:hypothetical protein
MNMIVRCLACVFVLISLQACSGITVSQDYEETYNFSALKTFSWKPNPDNEYGLTDNDLVDSRIRKALENDLLAKSYKLVDSGKPDFYVSYQMSVEQKITSGNLSGGISIGRGSGGSYGGIGVGTGNSVRAYDQGTLLIDVTEVGSDQLVWRGVSTQIVSEHSNPEKTTEMVNATVAKILEQFPPR